MNDVIYYYIIFLSICMLDVVAFYVFMLMSSSVRPFIAETCRRVHVYGLFMLFV